MEKYTRKTLIELTTMFKDRAFVSAKGCFDRAVHPTEACVHLGEATNVLTRKRRFYCGRDFPKDCSVFGCPKRKPLDERWRKDLEDPKKYE